MWGQSWNVCAKMWQEVKNKRFRDGGKIRLFRVPVKEKARDRDKEYY